MDAPNDLLDYYSRFFVEGVIDLSASNPPPPEIDPSQLPPPRLDYVPPSGAPGLAERIAARYQTVAPAEVLVTAGASEALAAIALALLGPGSRVVAPRPSYPSFLETARAVGAELHFDDHPSGAIDLALTCNPTAPAGQLVDLPAFLAATEAAGGIPVVDEVYRELSLGGEPIPAAVDLSGRAISVGGLSKPVGAGGLRIGWLVTHDVALRPRLDRQLQHLSGGPAGPSIPLAEYVLDHFDEWVSATLARARCNGRHVCEALHHAGWTFEPPRAGITVSARPPFDVSSAAEQRLRAAGYFLVPCRVLGPPGEYRVSLLAPPGDLRRALRLLAGESG